MKAWFVLSFNMANKGSCSRITRKEHFVRWLVHSGLNEDQSDSTDDDINEIGQKEHENIISVSEWDSCLLDTEEQYHLPRSSPVISRKRCNAELKPEKQSSPLNLCLTPPACDGSKLAISPSNNSNPHKLDGFTHSEKPEKLSLLSNKVLMSLSHKKEDSTRIPCNLDNCDFHNDILQQSKLCNKYCTDIFPLVSQMTQDSGDPCSESAPGSLRVPLNNGLESGCKRRALSDIPPASSHLVSSGQARKHGSFIDVHPTEDIYRNSLDQENAHFVVVDMLLEVLETVKWAVCLQQFKNAHPCQKRYETHNTTKTDSFSSCDSGFEDDSTPKLPSKGHCLDLFQGSQSSSTPCSAEDLAHCLVSEFRKQWFPPDNLNIALQEVRVVKRQHTFMQLAAQYTFPMTAGDRISLTEEIKQKSRMRGTLTWAPPRFQIIFYVQPTLRRSDVITAQHFLCAGCGTEVEPRYIKKLRYCDYLGKYFCDGCHGGEESVIPGRVLSNWDFARYPVCHFSRQLLDSIWQQPLFRLTSVAKKLYSQAKELQRFTDLQEQLISTKKLLSKCRLSAGVLVEFEQIPDHLMQELDLFSMDDLIRVKKGQLCMVAKAIFQSATAHIDTCELCQAKGFICEFCHGKEVLFPFQKDTCTRCQDCRACFHISCFRDEPCPKCVRLQKRKKIQEAISS